MRFKDWNIEAITGYTPITTYYMDFSIADAFGVNAIKDTYKRCLENMIDYKYLTEFCMALNWKIHEHYHDKNNRYVELYSKLWNEADIYAQDTLTGDELTYYYRTTD